jgi:hypothetical protein
MKMSTKRAWLATYAIGISLFVLSAVLPCTSGCTGWLAGLSALIFAVVFPFHSLAILVVLLSPLALRQILKGRARAVWIVLLICLPALWFSPAAVNFPIVRPGYFIWTFSVSLVALSLIMLSHIASPIRMRSRRWIIGCAVVIALTYFVTHPYCVHPRFWQLQFAGRLPDNAKHPKDHLIAEQTYWWGNRLDPKQFWADKVVWHDEVSESEARRQGRGYPPMPYDDPLLHDRSDRNTHSDGIGGPDSGPSIRYLYTERERAFWDKFTKTHPLPPAYIEREQQDYGRSMVHKEYILAHDPVYAARLGLKSDAPQRTVESARYQLRAFGFPVEALTTNALFWAYVLEQRSEYQKMMTSWSQHPSVVSNHIARLQVDPHLITEPLTSEQTTQANAWKLEYLKRLKRDGVDHSYINAYLRAWELDPTQITKEE